MPKSHALCFCLAASQVIMRADSREATLGVVHSNDPNDPNKSFSKYTPTASFNFSITNPDAFDFLQPGALYDIVMVPRDSGLTIQVQAQEAEAQPLPVAEDAITQNTASTDAIATAASTGDPGTADASVGDEVGTEALVAEPEPRATPVIDAAAAILAAAASTGMTEASAPA